MEKAAFFDEVLANRLPGSSQSFQPYKNGPMRKKAGSQKMDSRMCFTQL